MAHITTRWNLPHLELGLGLRTPHLAYIRNHWPAVGWFEIISENYIDNEGRTRDNLEAVSARYPIVMHGVSLSVGTADPLDFAFLRKLKTLADRYDVAWMGDHVCWTGVNGVNGHDLYPIPYNEPMLRHLVDRIRTIQDFLERPLVLENPSTYATFAASTMTEQTFIRRMAEEADCALLLDVNNVYVTCRNHGLDAHEYLDEIPLDRVVQIHLAGHSDMGSHCIDTHDDFVIDEVWDLYAEVIQRAGPRATLLEWDDHIPEFEVAFAELSKAAAYRDRVAPTLAVEEPGRATL